VTATIRERGPIAGGPVLVVVLAGTALGCVSLLAWLGILGWGPFRGHRDAGSVPIVVVAVLATTGMSSAVGIGRWVGRDRGHVDVAARLLATPSELRRSTTDGVRTVAASVGYGHVGSPGAYIGRSVRGGHDLWGSWEEVQVDISGPRTGKTSTRVIPNVVAAPGAVLVTSCKRDVVDATRDVRARRGRVWVFDPQNGRDDTLVHARLSGLLTDETVEADEAVEADTGGSLLRGRPPDQRGGEWRHRGVGDVLRLGVHGGVDGYVHGFSCAGVRTVSRKYEVVAGAPSVARELA